MKDHEEVEDEAKQTIEETFPEVRSFIQPGFERSDLNA